MLGLLWQFHRLNANELLLQLRIVDVDVDEFIFLEDGGLLQVVIERLFFIDYGGYYWLLLLLLELLLILDDYFN